MVENKVCDRFVPRDVEDVEDDKFFPKCAKCDRTEGKHIYDRDGDRIGSGRGYGGGQGVSKNGPSSPFD